MENILKLLCGTNSSSDTFDRTAFWTFLSAIATAAVAFIAWYQLYGLKKVSRADFIKKFNGDFFNPMNRMFILLCDNNAIEFKNKKINYSEDDSDDFPYFEVKRSIIKQLPISKESSREMPIRDTYTSYEIDDFLGNFEDIGKFEKEGFSGVQDVYDSFGWYILKTWNNVEIQKYVDTQRVPEEDLYENFYNIFNKCNAIEKSKKLNKIALFRRLRW